MLKISDYVSIMAGFLGILVFYLIFSGDFILDFAVKEELPVIERETISVRQESGETEYVILYGINPGDPTSTQIVDMMEKLKKPYLLVSSMESLSERQKEAADVFIVTTSDYDKADESEELLHLAKKDGKKILYAAISEEESDYTKELGILHNGEETQVDGFMIFEGLLTQGMLYYEKFPIDIRKITLDATCTRLIQELNSEVKESKDLLPILWKKQYGEGKIYISNGPLLAEADGIGIFSGILYDMQDVFVYPVVNAAAVLMDYYPEFDQVDLDLIMKRYSRSSVMYCRDVIWPAIVKVADEEDLIFTGRTYMENRTADFDDLEQQMRRNGSAILESDEGDILPIIVSGHTASDRKRYQMESFSSGEGLASCYLDMRNVMGVGSEDYEWAFYSLELSKTLYDIYRNNQFIQAVDWREAEERYKRYEKVFLTTTVSSDTLSIHADGFADVYYCIIRTDRNLDNGDGYEVEQIGDDAWFVMGMQQEITIPAE